MLALIRDSEKSNQICYNVFEATGWCSPYLVAVTSYKDGSLNFKISRFISLWDEAFFISGFNRFDPDTIKNDNPKCKILALLESNQVLDIENGLLGQWINWLVTLISLSRIVEAINCGISTRLERACFTRH